MLTLLDVDSSLLAQPPLRERLDDGRATRLDLLDLGPRLRLWATSASWRQFVQRVRARPRPAPGQTELIFMGSGDYHNLTPALLEDLPEPVTLVHFDNHPDWVRFAPRRHCGAWVNRALALPNIRRVVTLGPCSEDLDSPQLRGGNVAALSRGDLQLFPWQHAPSKVWGRVQDGPGHVQRENRLHWRNLVDEDWPAFLRELVASLPTEAIWITVDKDVLATEDAATNWDQGGMRLSHLLTAIRALAAGKRVLGIDVCGEFALPAHRNLFKRWEARSDQPPPQRWSATDLERNATTNQALIALFEELFR